MAKRNVDNKFIIIGIIVLIVLASGVLKKEAVVAGPDLQPIIDLCERDENIYECLSGVPSTYCKDDPFTLGSECTYDQGCQPYNIVHTCNVEVTCSGPDGAIGDFICNGGDVRECVEPGLWDKVNDCESYTGYIAPCLYEDVISQTEQGASIDCTPESIDYICVGAVPSNSQLCTGDEDGLTEHTVNTVVSTCTTTSKCEYICDTGYIKSGDVCVSLTSGLAVSSKTATVVDNKITATFGFTNSGTDDIEFLLEVQAVRQSDVNNLKKTGSSAQDTCDQNCIYNVHKVVTVPSGTATPMIVTLDVPGEGEMESGTFALRALSYNSCGGGIVPPFEKQPLFKENLIVSSSIPENEHALCAGYCGNYICEAEIGETYLNCADCPIPDDPTNKTTSQCLAFIQECDPEGTCTTTDDNCVINPMMYYVIGFFIVLVLIKSIPGKKK